MFVTAKRITEGGGLVRRVGLAPVVGERPKILVLGTIPSEMSDRLGQYYGNPKNQFWRLMEGVLGEPLGEDYAGRKGRLMSGGVALWDVLAECDIDRSKDSSIVDPVANDIPSFISEHATITHVFLNGSKAAELFDKLVSPLMPSAGPRPVIVLPSSSTARAMRFEDKAGAWAAIRYALGKG